MQNANWQNLMQTRRRPLGVTILAILMGIQAVFFVIVGVIAIVALAFVHPLAGLLASFILILGILSLILVWGLWTLKPWAFWATVALEAISLIQGLISITQNNGAGIGSIVLPVIILVYFFADPNVRAAFRT